MIEAFLLYIVIPKRINILQLGRYSSSSEQRFRQNYSKHFEWIEFNSELSKDVLTGKRKAIVIDPIFISKSGKTTSYIYQFWSSCNGRAMRVLEILGVGLVGLDNKDCMSLFAVQTSNPKVLNTASWTFVDWYLYVIEKKITALLKLTLYVVADAWFSKHFFSQVLEP